MSASESDSSYDTEELEYKKWNRKFIATATVSTISLGLAAGLLFANPFSGAITLGVGLTGSVVGYWLPSPKRFSSSESESN